MTSNMPDLMQAFTSGATAKGTLTAEQQAKLEELDAMVAGVDVESAKQWIAARKEVEDALTPILGKMVALSGGEYSATYDRTASHTMILVRHLPDGDMKKNKKKISEFLIRAAGPDKISFTASYPGQKPAHQDVSSLQEVTTALGKWFMQITPEKLEELQTGKAPADTYKAATAALKQPTLI